MKREELIRHIQEAHARIETIRSRAASRTGPPAPGDLYFVGRTRWLVVREHPDDPTALLVVPVDDHPLLGTCDVPIEAPDAARCGCGSWAHAAVFRDRVDHQPDAVRPVREVMARLARGQATGRPGDADEDPEYERASRRWLRAAEKVSDLLVFEDGNCPGLVYQGTTAHWDGLIREGGYPIRIHPARVGQDGLVDCGPEGRCPIRRVPDHWR